MEARSRAIFLLLRMHELFPMLFSILMFVVTTSFPAPTNNARFLWRLRLSARSAEIIQTTSFRFLTLHSVNAGYW